MLDKMMFPFTPEPSWYDLYWYAAEAEPARCPHPLRCRLERLGRRIHRLVPDADEEPAPVPAWAMSRPAQRRRAAS